MRLQTALMVLALFSPVWVQAQTQVDAPQFADVVLPDAPSSSQAQALTNQTQASSNQAQTPQPAAMDEKEKKRLERQQAEQELQAEEHQRIAGVLPNFNTVMGGHAAPLTAGQKMRASFRSAIDPAQFGIALVSAAYGQATDSHSSIDDTGFRHGYDQGTVAYFKRFGAAYVDQFDGTILGNGVFPALLHQDSRYFRLGTGPLRHRFFYAAGSTIRCKGDNGKWQPNVSNLLGNLAAGGLSNLYYPAAERGFELTIQQGLIVTAEGALGSMLLEFYPDVQRHFHRKKHADVTSPAQP